MSYDRLPPGLKEETTFCLYKLEPGKDGKKKKVPYQTSGARADPGNKAHLTDFTTAYETYCNGGYDGIGLSVAENMAAVDIDDCVVDGKLNVFAQEIVDKLGTYAEFSPSGTGVHIWGRAPNLLYDKAKYYMKNSDMKHIIEETKTEAGKRKIPITEDVAQMFQDIIEDREPPKMEKVIDGHTGFLFYDDDGNPLVVMHWQNRFNRMVGRYNDIYRVQMPNITPHVCRHTYCSNMAKSGMNPKTLQYLMGHSDISVTMNVYTHISFDDAEEELKRMEEFRKAQAEIEKKNDAKAVSQKMFKVV